MRWDGETAEQENARLNDWHKWFAWYPVQLKSGQWVWWENLWRIRTGYDWQYSDALVKPEQPYRPDTGSGKAMSWL